jgi:hypothetical protein
MLIGYWRGLKKQVDSNSIDIKQIQTEIGLMRVTWPEKYYTREEIKEMALVRDTHTAEHRERVEKALHDQTSMISKINDRLDTLHRFQHRASDDH